ncbi:filamentous hemagglutinin N-terminal domain-containing protein [Oscillatoria sp. FACHB-1407]|uniref:two-partner secretion domain-containing protein n=1 Tax=Oscillatoria sp. FACHB-1407 TaxID=2692847 RepID=UPI001685054B|nr:filamentous hemagglutinin N-terminal domain-containing protein [Oscillatoria sp. FACHB-1407]MBD2465201.1 filamentous hemagglutinin N-terminal domain-containing protein [Oscillatoria sp. FACHB-1407]
MLGFPAWIRLFSGGVTVWGLLSLATAQNVQAQILPDNTLGTERSMIRPDPTGQGGQGNRIEGGALRGANLFHSFSQFNVGEGQRVYFSNPSGVQNILTRVTGGTVSNILGTLGVDGAANLFLLNPSGIVLGANAQLDIRGAFVASTGDRFSFSDGSEFSATNPQTPPLLSINVPIGLQPGRGSIINRGNLTTGGGLTLAAGNLDLQGQLRAGQNLTLQAADTVLIRDTTLQPFIASAHGRLTIQGDRTVDIFALNHPSSGLFSGGDMVLRSPNPVIGDAHYWSGGGFRVEQLNGGLGDLVSPNDPIIRTSGDVEFESYTGASLHIFAGGRVTIPGNITITGADPANGWVETVTLSDGSTLPINGRTQPTLDIRAGTTAFTAANPPLARDPNPAITSVIGTSAEIAIGSIINPGGTIFLTNQYQPNRALPGGNIQTGGISTGIGNLAGDSVRGGNITIDARGSIDLMGNVDTAVTEQVIVTSGDINQTAIGGDILLLANENITTQVLDSSVRRLVFTRDAVLNDGIVTNAQLSATAGRITLDAGGAIATANLNSTVYADVLINATDPLAPIIDAGEIGTIQTTATGGRIGLTATDTIRTGFINSAAEAQANADAEGVTFARAAATAGQVGDVSAIVTGGDVAMVAGGLISAEEIYTRTSARANASVLAFGRGSAVAGEIGNTTAIARSGNVNLSTTDDVTTREVLTSAEAFLNANAFARTDANIPILPGNAGNSTTIAESGAIAIESSGFTTTENLSTYARANVSVAAQAISRQPEPFLDTGTIQNVTVVARGGDVSLQANAALTTGRINTAIETNPPFSPRDIILGAGSSGGIQAHLQGGDIALQTRGHLAVEELTAGVDLDAVSQIRAAGQVTLAAEGGRIQLQANQDITTASLDSSINDGNSLPIVAGEILENGQLTARGGTISLLSQSGEVRLNDGSTLRSNVNAASGDGGNGGDIGVRGNSVSFTNNLLTTTVNGQGRAGDITILATGAVSIDGSRLVTGLEPGAESTGQGGAVQIAADTIQFSNFSLLNTATFGVGDAGNVFLTANRDIQLRDSSIFSLTAGRGRAGSINLQAGGAVRLEGNSVINTSAILSETGAGGDISIGAAEGVFITGVGTRQPNVNFRTSATLPEIEPNNATNEDFFDRGVLADFPLAQVIDPSLTVNATANPDVLLSDQIPYVSIAGVGGGDTFESNNFDYYAFNVDAVGTQAIFDIDNANAQGDINTLLRLYDSGGNEIASNNNAPITLGAGGSTSPNDAYLTYIFNKPGTYYLRVSEFSTIYGYEIQIASQGTYTLQTSLIDNFLVSSGISTQTRALGQAGDITLSSPLITLQNGGQISADTFRGGNAGDITLQPFNQGQSLTVTLQNSQISGSTRGAGQGGNLRLTSPNSLTLQGDGQLTVETTALGQAGNVEIDTGLLDVRGNIQVSATAAETAQPQAQGGNIFVRSDRVNLSDTSSLLAETQGTGQAGSIALQPNYNNQLTIALSENSRISAATTDRGQGGSLTVIAPDAVQIRGNGELTVETRGAGQAGNIRLAAPTLTLQEGARISATATTTATAQTQGGNITVSSDRLNVSGATSGIFAETTGAARAGNLVLQPYNRESMTIHLQGGAQISASTSGTGQGGTLQVTAPQAIAFWGDGILSARSTATGNAGNLQVQTRQLTLRDEATISASSRVSTGGNIQLSGLQALQVLNGTISASTETGRSGNLSVEMQPGGDIALNRSRLTSAATGGGQAGSVEIWNADRLTLGDRAQITVSSTGQGSAGDLRIRAGNIRLGDRSRITADTAAGRGGDIVIEAANSLELSGNSDISTSTMQGRAGNLSITLQEGGSVVMSDRSRLAAEATGTITDQSVPVAGNLTIRSNRLRVEGNSVITVSSTAGQAGTLSITTRDLQLNNGQLTAETGFTSSNREGANLQLLGLEQLLMRNSSLISARAFDDADGGNLSINAPSGFILALPNENNDLIATAERGTGGNIRIQANRLFGLQDQTSTRFSFAQLRRNSTSDISASSEFGASGAIAFDLLSTDPSQGLVELPTTVIDASQQIAQHCGRNEVLNGEFVVTGRGGLPPNPGELLSGSNLLTGWVSVNDSGTSNASVASSSEPPVLIEAQTWRTSANGTIELLASAPVALSTTCESLR